MEREEVVALLDIQRKVFNDVIDRLQREIKTNRDETDKHIAEVIRSLEFSQAETEDLKKKLNTVLKENENYKELTNALKDDNDNMKMKLKDIVERTDYLDDQRRQNNLRFSGISEGEAENWQQCQQKVSKILHERFNITPSFERVYRVGKSST